MPLPNLAQFVKDYSKSFWNGDAQLSIQLKQLAEAFDNNPDITVAQMRDSSATPLLRSDVGFETPQDLRLGELNGLDNKFSIGFSASAGMQAGLEVVLSPAGIASLSQTPPEMVSTAVSQFVQMSGQQGLVILWMDGQAGGGLKASGLFQPALQVGFDLKAGGEYEWFYCLPAADGDKVASAVRDAFSQARLPQSSLSEAARAGHPVGLQKNEIYGSRLTGFLNLGVEASFGYTFSGARNFSLGKLDLASQLIVEAAAKISLSHQLTGAFRILVMSGDEPGWNRVVVQKDHQTDFEFAFAVSVDAQLSTPQAQAGGLALIEGILGTSTGQILDTALGYAQMTPQQFRQQADGFIQGVVAQWVGKGFDEIPQQELQTVLGKLQQIQQTIQGLDGRAVSLYEKLLGKIDFPTVISQLQSVLQAGDLEAQKQRLLDLINNQQVREFAEELLNQKFAAIFADYQNLYQQLESRLNQFNQLVTSQAEEDLRQFIQSKLKALKLDQLASQLAHYDTPQELRSKATSEAQELVSRLLGKPFDAIFQDPKVDQAVAEINRFGKDFSNTLSKAGDLVSKALNSKARFQLAFDYQKAQKGEKLVDIQIRVLSDGKPDPAGLKLYQEAVSGQFQQVFQDENLSRIKIGSARFTDSLKKSSKLQVGILGWNFQGTASLLSQLDASVQVGKTGLMTVYNFQVEGDREADSQRLSVAVNYMLHLSGAVQGAPLSESELGKADLSAQQALQSLDNRFEYDIASELTTLDELESYFQLAVELNVIDSGQMEKLVQTVAHLRKQGLDAANYGKVKVHYTFSFSGQALARALANDYSADLGLSDANPEALRRIYADRLIASYYASPERQAAGLGVAALYQAGFLEQIEKVGNPEALQFPDSLPFRQGSRSVEVRVQAQDRMWAERHYLLNRHLAQSLDGFRQQLAIGKKIPFSDLEQFLNGLAGQLQKIDKGPQKALPLLLLDEQVRLSSKGDPQARSGLVEVTLYDKSGTQPLNTIPISA